MGKWRFRGRKGGLCEKKGKQERFEQAQGEGIFQLFSFERGHGEWKN